MAALFVYGTLMLEEVMRAVTGRQFRSQPASLDGFARYRLRDQVYPGLVPKARARTKGRLYEGVSSQVLQRLDHFEGSAYRRISVTVKTPRGRVSAVTYVMAPGMEGLLSREPWDLEQFREHHLQDFLHGYRGFRP